MTLSCSHVTINTAANTLAACTAAKLLKLCAVPQKDWPRLFRRKTIGIGDYMGTGYEFMDAFNKIYDEFEEYGSDKLHRVIRNAINKEANNGQA